MNIPKRTYIIYMSLFMFFHICTQTEGVYYWSDNWHVVYTNWGPDQPVKPENGGCVAMDINGKWADSACSLRSPFVCRKTSG